MKHCVITGAADGIGRALALQFGRAGYRITGIDIDRERARHTQADLTAAGATAEFLMTNLAAPADIEQTVKQLASGPAIDVLIHNAGINAVGRFETIPLAAQQQVINVNLIAPQLLTAGLLKAGKIANGGSLVFVASLSCYVAYPGAAVYAATKDGLASYARSLSVALTAQKIHTLTVFPGPTRTAHARRYSPDNSRESKRMPPDELAGRIFTAVLRRQHRLIPGFGNRLFALAGSLFPGIVHLVMRNIILNKLAPQD